METFHYPVKRNTLAKIYKINPKTFRYWLHEIEIFHGRTLSPGELRKMIEAYGLPGSVEIKI